MTCSCPSVKGYVTRKSTAFAPNGAKYGMQSMVHDHMMAHYKLIDKAKSSIDNKPPKCMKKFIKAHSKKLASKRLKERHGNDTLNDTFTSQALSLSPDRRTADNILLDSSNTSGENSPVKRQSRVTAKTQDYTGNLQYENSPPYVRMEPSHSLEAEFLQRNLSPVQQSSHEEDFNKSFINKRSSSAISYKSALKLSTSKLRTSTPSFKTEMYVPEEGLQPLKGSILEHSAYSVITANSTRRLTSSYNNDLLKSHNNDLNLSLSRLSLSKSGSKNQTSAMNESKNQTSAFNESFIQSKRLSSSNGRVSGMTNRSLLESSFIKMQEQEELIVEEKMYLNFIEDVTSDVLARGIYSDRVLCQVFDTHIAKNQGILNEERMQDLIDELKIDLGLNELEVQPN